MAQRAPAFDVNTGGGVVVELNSLCSRLSRLRDRRHARGIRYPLVVVLVFIILAKLAGEDHLAGIAEWVHYRIEALAQALGLKEARAPHRTTYSRILGRVVDVAEFEEVVREYFSSQGQGGQSVHIAMDGKTLRGTIPAGETQGLHLLAAYLPDEGWVLVQVEVGEGENELSAAPRVLQALDLRGKIVTGDALFAQRELSVQIVEGGGDYVWTVKANQPQLYQDIAQLFEPEQCVKGFSPGT